jgi:hypothetical protein
VSTGTLERQELGTCEMCGFQFEYVRRGPHRHRCDDCKKATERQVQRRAYLRRKAAAQDQDEVTMLLPDGHPVLPLLSAFVNHQCAVRLALAALRTGRLAEAEALLAGELPR